MYPLGDTCEHEERRSMRIELQRAFSLEVMREEECGICGVAFRVESVIAVALTDENYGVGWVCPECIRYLGERNPEASSSPALAEYRSAVERYSEPMWPSLEEIGRAEEEGTFEEAYAASWLS